MTWTKRAIVCIASAGLLYTTAANVRAQTFWDGTHQGLSIDDIKKAYPGAENQDDGSLQIITKVLGHPASVRFFFDARTLNKERIIILDTGEVVAQEIVNALTLKYGSPLGCDNLLAGRMSECKWSSKKTIITSIEMHYAGPPFIAVEYELGPERNNNL